MIDQRSWRTAYDFLGMTVSMTTLDHEYQTLSQDVGVVKGPCWTTLLTNTNLVLCVCETKISEDAPNAIRYDVAPLGYEVLHIHWGQGGPTHGDSLVLIYESSLSIRPCKSSFSWTFFQLHLANLISFSFLPIYADHGLVLNPSSWQLANLIMLVGIDAADWLSVQQFQYARLWY